MRDAFSESSEVLKDGLFNKRESKHATETQDEGNCGYDV